MGGRWGARRMCGGLDLLGRVGLDWDRDWDWVDRLGDVSMDRFCRYSSAPLWTVGRSLKLRREEDARR